MEYVNINDISDFQESKVIKKIPIISDQLLSTLYFIDSDSNLPKHEHAAYDEIQYIVSGGGTITVDGESQPISAGMLILVPRASSHNFSTSKDRLTILSIGITTGNNPDK